MIASDVVKRTVDKPEVMLEDILVYLDSEDYFVQLADGLFKPLLKFR